MNDYVTGINQNPVALPLPADRPCTIATFLQAAREMLGHRADMARRATTGDHRGIAQRRSTFQIDGHDILGLVVIQRHQDALQ